MIIKRKIKKDIIKKEDKTQQSSSNEVSEAKEQTVEEIVEEIENDDEIDLFDLDNINFKQRQERRRGDRRRGFRRIDDRNLISRAKEEANAIKEAAVKDGYTQGLQTAQEDIQSIKEAIQFFFESEQAVFENIAPDILDISFDIAKKIIKKEVTDDNNVILNNIKDILKGLSKEESKITIQVNPMQAPLIKQELPEMAQSLGLEVKIYVTPDENIMEGGCVLTTSNGVIDASIEAQLSVISEVLKEI